VEREPDATEAPRDDQIDPDELESQNPEPLPDREQMTVIGTPKVLLFDPQPMPAEHLTPDPVPPLEDGEVQTYDGDGGVIDHSPR
jgi:hypothetical protein